MPYEGEFAHYHPLQRIAASEQVARLLGRQRIAAEGDGVPPVPPFTAVESLAATDWQPDWVLAIDGSHQPVPVRNGYPTAEVGYVTVASALINAAKVRELDSQRPTDPTAFRSTEQPESIDAALPGANVVIDDESSAQHSLRRALLDAIAETRMTEDGETLLQTYEHLLQSKPDGAVQQCPHTSETDCGRPFLVGQGEYRCPCDRALPLFSTDALRIHEGMLPDASNGAMFAEIMQAWERLWLLNILRTLEAKNWLGVLKRVAIVIDGPLAVFGHPAWLSHSIRRELIRLNGAVRTATGTDILLLGVEKTGLFVEHFSNLDAPGERGESSIRGGSFLLLTDDYIKTRILYSRSNKQYGRDTYFGRKFFYKTRSGARVVGTLPFLREEHRDLSHGEIDDFPRLADALGVIEQFASVRYANALSPLVAAHSEAAIPLHLGRRVLERIARDLLNEVQGSR